MGVYPTMTNYEQELFDNHMYSAPGVKAHMPQPQRPYQLDPQFKRLVGEMPQCVDNMCTTRGCSTGQCHTSYAQPQTTNYATYTQPQTTTYVREYGTVGSNACAACAGALPQHGTYVTANDRCFHHECFRCTSCNDSIHGLKYKLVNGQVQCLTCSSPPCDACRRPIDGRQLTAEGRVYHPECFRCNKCDEPLRGEYAINPRNGDRLCKRCDAPQCDMCHRVVNDGESYHCSKDNVVRCVPCARGAPRQGPSYGGPHMGYAPHMGAPRAYQRPGGYWRQVPAPHAYGPAGPYGPPRRGMPKVTGGGLVYAGPPRSGPPPMRPGPPPAPMHMHGPQDMAYRRPQRRGPPGPPMDAGYGGYARPGVGY